jgi:hypothetical protein
MTAFEFLRGRSSGASSSKRPIPPISLMSFRFPFYLRYLSAPFAAFPFALSTRVGGRRAPAGGASPLPTAHLWGPQRRPTTVYRSRTFWRSPPAPTVLIWSLG